MKRMTATVLFITAISSPALAESPMQRQLHSWDYVQQVATSAQAPTEAPVIEHHEQRPYYHHEQKSEGKHHHKHHHDGKHHHAVKHHHKHHHHDATKKDDTKPAQEQPKQ